MLPQGTLLHSYVQGQVGEQQVEVPMVVVLAQEVEVVLVEVEEEVVPTTSQIPVHLHLALRESYALVCTLLLPLDLLSHLLEQDPTNTCHLFSPLPFYPPHRVSQTHGEPDHKPIIPLRLRKVNLMPAYLV